MRGKPSAILLDTHKGIGISFAEHVEFNHYMVVDETMANEAIRTIEERFEMRTFPGGDSID